MKPSIRMLLATLFALVLGSPPSGHAQTSQKTLQGHSPSEADTQKEKHAVLHRPPAQGRSPAEG